jgi:hypothetical protein
VLRGAKITEVGAKLMEVAGLIITTADDGETLFFRTKDENFRDVLDAQLAFLQ